MNKKDYLEENIAGDNYKDAGNSANQALFLIFGYLISIIFIFKDKLQDHFALLIFVMFSLFLSFGFFLAHKIALMWVSRKVVDGEYKHMTENWLFKPRIPILLLVFYFFFNS